MLVVHGDEGLLCLKHAPISASQEELQTDSRCNPLTQSWRRISPPLPPQRRQRQFDSKQWLCTVIRHPPPCHLTTNLIYIAMIFTNIISIVYFLEDDGLWWHGDCRSHHPQLCYGDKVTTGSRSELEEGNIPVTSIQPDTCVKESAFVRQSHVFSRIHQLRF